MEAFLNVLEISGCILFVIFFLGLCVFIHEFGHFITAKLCGLHVSAFSIGFKKAWGKKIGGVDYRIGWLPFGGYVDIPQIDATGVPHTEDGRELPPAKPLYRLLSAFAGPFFNILFGLALGCVVWVIGVPQDSPRMREIVVASIDSGGPEYRAGLRAGDRIFKLNGKQFFCTWKEFVFKTILTIGKVKLDVKRQGRHLEISYVPKQNPNAPEVMKFEKMPWPFFLAKIPIEMFPARGSPAAAAGMKNGDIIISINGRRIESYDDFFAMINYSGGKTLNLLVDRDGKIIKLAPMKPVLYKEAMEAVKDVYLIGVVFVSESRPLKMLAVMPDAPADRAGIKPGDQVVSVNARDIPDLNAFKAALKPLKDQPFTLRIKRGSRTLDIRLAAAQRRIYDIGVSLMILDYPTPWQQFMNVIDMSYKSLRALGVYFMNKAGMTGEKSGIKPRNLSGPVGLAATLYRSVKDGSIRFGLFFVVMVSFALAIFNLLPLPVLDGGHMMLALIEIIIRRPLHEGVVRALTLIFIFLLITLMVYVTYFDILRRMPENWQKIMDPEELKKAPPATVVNGGNNLEKTPVENHKNRR
ncbi:MAG: site-2 protease family protein [Victivallaceae bacterium]|nr:site-2 protease family protein [Victivallaceae bacterium]